MWRHRSQLRCRPLRVKKSAAFGLRPLSGFGQITIVDTSKSAIISIKNLGKTYASKGSAPAYRALSEVNLEIQEGEIFALLGPNGAGKTTLINIVCGIVNPTEGTVTADGHDVVREYRAARKKIGLVPQELATDMFEKVWDTVSFSRGVFGHPKNPELIEKILKDLSLWEKRANKIMTLSGGMKRRVMIAKALSHEPKILFLDEPTAGVDVELRREMWEMVRKLRAGGVTVILTTHYIEEAEEMADRIGIINKGKIVLIEDKNSLMSRLGKKRLTIQLQQPLSTIPAELSEYELSLECDGLQIVHTYDAHESQTGIARLLRHLEKLGIEFKDLQTEQSSLEEIFVTFVHNGRSAETHS